MKGDMQNFDFSFSTGVILEFYGQWLSQKGIRAGDFYNLMLV